MYGTPAGGGSDPFGVVSQFISLREGLGTSPLAPQAQAPQLAQIQPNRAAAPMASPAAPTSVARPAGGPTPGVQGGRFAELRSMFPGLRETSGYRTPEHNAEVGGVPNSYHTLQDQDGNSRAFDFVGSEADMQAAMAWARANGASESLTHNVGSGFHLHVAY